MLRYVIRRSVSMLISLAVASMVIFGLVEIAPGDPASFMLGLGAQEDTITALRTQLGLDMPRWQRYLYWVQGMMVGDFGISYTYRTSVAQMISDRLWVSVPLALYALLLSMLIAFPVGLWAASRRGRAADTLSMGLAQLGIAIPNFWVAMILVLIFAVNLRWFSAGGFPGWEGGIAGGVWSLTLPAIALALPQGAILARVMRSALIDVMNEDYIRTARAKGLSQGQTLRRHALRNALIPVLTILGLQFAFLLAGGIIIEQVFYLPGLGRLVFQSIASRDLIVVESIVMLLVFAVIMINFLVDLAYAAVDPRLRQGL